MKAILKFKLPEDRVEFEMYRKAPDYHHALCEFGNKLRRWSKDGAQPSLSDIMDEYHRILEEIEFEH